MDRDRMAATAKEKEIEGSVKETVGKAVGDAKLRSDGKVDRFGGKIQHVIGGLKDAVKK